MQSYNGGVVVYAVGHAARHAHVQLIARAVTKSIVKSPKHTKLSRENYFPGSLAYRIIIYALGSRTRTRTTWLDPLAISFGCPSPCGRDPRMCRGCR